MRVRKIIAEKIFRTSVDKTIDRIVTFINPRDKIIDLGAGTCLLTHQLRERGYSVFPVDVKNRSYYLDIQSQIYDGKNLPFKNNEFDICLLLAVLHHTPNPEAVMQEAVRVSKKLIVSEDAVTNVFQRLYTFFIDSILNKELIAPHSNKTDKQWRSLYKNLGLILIRTENRKSWLFLQNPLYFLKKEAESNKEK